MKTLSIVTVTRNESAQLSITLKSIRREKNSEVEYIVIDGNSNDDTNSVIMKNKDLIDTYISENDKGIYDAMNKGLRYASGRYVLFLNSGDELIGVCRVLNEIRDLPASENKILLYASRFSWPNSMTKVLQPRLTFCNMPASHQATLFPVKLAKKFEYNISYKFSADYNLYLTILNEKQSSINLYDHIIVKTAPVGFTESSTSSYLYECCIINLKFNNTILSIVRFGIELLKLLTKKLLNKFFSKSIISNIRKFRGGKY